MHVNTASDLEIILDKCADNSRNKAVDNLANLLDSEPLKRKSSYQSVRQESSKLIVNIR